MAKVAVLADIHGNIPALEAVLEDIAKREVDEVLVGGDLVGRGPQGSAVIRRIRELGWPSVRGNHEDYLIEFRRGKVPAEWQTSDEWRAPRWMAAELSGEDLDFILEFPLSLISNAIPELHLVHGSPFSNGEGIGPWTSEEQFETYLEAIEQPLLVCCHTHRPLHRRIGDGQVVNVGSVGLPFNGDPRAQYAVFEGQAGEVDFEFVQVEYDRSRLLDIYVESGFAEAAGVTAELLRLEIETATPHLVPFLHWASRTNRTATAEHFDDFRAFHDPGESLRSFFARLEALSEG